MKSYNVMMDLETFDVLPTGIVLTIGLVKFDPTSMDEPFDGIHIKLDPKEQKDLGRTINRDTLAWWKRQTPEVQEAALSPEGRIPLRQALSQIQDYFKVLNSEDHNQGAIHISEVWGQGYGFDMTMLKSLFLMCEMELPWRFYQLRDSRTLFHLMPEDPRPTAGKDNLHNALSDAYYQAIGVQKTFKALRELKYK